jgi:pteridine reductase
VNSAASFENAPFDEITGEAWDAVMAVNLRAPFLCSQAAARLMRASSGAGVPGLIVNVSDISGLTPWRGYAHHGVSKAALLHLTRVAARELGPHVRVNAVVPGPILPPPGEEEGSEAWRRRGERLPLRRTGRPQDIGEAVVFLARNDFITGETIVIDGGERLLAGGR